MILFQRESPEFDIIELGAGDGFKTKVLLRHFLNYRQDFVYLPVDISMNVISQITENLKEELPGLNVQGKNKEYFEFLSEMRYMDSNPKIILFLGSNIGNFTFDESVDFLSGISKYMTMNDLLMVGFDLKKDPAIIEAAYNDSKGVTRDFNLNLLNRINRELGGDFDTKRFIHHPVYDPHLGEARSYLISSEKQTVRLSKTGHEFSFNKWESIHTEISRKYDIDLIEKIAIRSGLSIYHVFYNEKQYFADVIFKIKV